MPMMFFHFLKIIFDISTSKRSKKYKPHSILTKKKIWNSIKSRLNSRAKHALTCWGDQLGPRDKIRLTANMVNVLCIFPAIDCGVMATCLTHHVTLFFHSCGNCFACLCLSSFVSLTLFNRTLKKKFVMRKIFVLNHALCFPWFFILICAFLGRNGFELVLSL
jgi:hypothetical protein